VTPAPPLSILAARADRAHQAILRLDRAGRVLEAVRPKIFFEKELVGKIIDDFIIYPQDRANVRSLRQTTGRTGRTGRKNAIITSIFHRRKQQIIEIYCRFEHFRPGEMLMFITELPSDYDPKRNHYNSTHNPGKQNE
jgi:hypothetical protein